MAWSPFRSILPRPRFTFLPSFSFLDDDFESEWEVGWRKTPRISKKAVDAMPTVEIDRSINCPICLEEFAIGEEAKEMPCKHKFHRECIVPWLETHCSCPLCRFEMPADDLEDSNKSDGVDGDGVEVDGDRGRRESRRNVRFAFVRSLWSHGYRNSYWNGSDGGDGDDRVEGDDDNDNDGDSGKFSLDATKGFSCRIIIPSVFQGMHSKKLGGFDELDEYNTMAMRTSGNERCYKLNMYNENWVNPSGKMGDSLWRDSAFATKETDQSSSF
ncbi:E3 ubiquitin-protein ligase RING1-like [Ananas comosus]|uniref:RING-type E3 ubiquitin transferase n=1 Tax=Ananas comosus TaxID=4615 RepID=A0A199W474_ANACO|nr:E3 ubiquitin-protein ligase RING1-like [Ananas comosus]